MTVFFDSYDKLFNHIIKFNSEEPIITDTYLIPISNKYYITLLDNTQKPIKKFFNYVKDESRVGTYPFVKEDNIDYEFALEKEQFYKIKLFKTNIRKLDDDLNEFIKTINESNAKVNLIIDIDYFINFHTYFQKNNIPNHFLDFLIFKLKRYSFVEHIFIINHNSLISRDCLLIRYLESITSYFNLIESSESFKQLLEKKIIVKKPKGESVIESIYWSLLDKNIVYEKINEIQSPIYNYDSFDIIKIDEEEYFAIEIQVSDIFYINLFEITDDNPGIVLNPLEKLNIFIE
jgi:hypothetical protein